MCFQALGKLGTVCCNQCGRHVHQICFSLWANTYVYNITCPTCKSKWTQTVPHKTDPESETKNGGLKTEDGDFKAVDAKSEDVEAEDAKTEADQDVKVKTEEDRDVEMF